MEQLSYGAFSADLHQRQAGERVPLQVSIEVTRRCPLECLHCYNNLPMGDMDAKRRELTKEEHFRVLDELVEMGCFWILYTGGEIFARKDFLEIYTYAKKKGFLITLFTNGTIINEQIADHLKEWPPFAIEITLYGRTRETYEALTAVPGSYDRCLRGISLLKERGLPLKLKTVATSINKHEIMAMRRFAEEELGVEFKMDGQINPRIDCSQSPLAVRLTPEEVVALDMSMPKGMSEYRRLAQRDLERPANLGQIDTTYFCGGGMNSFAINAYGEIGICVISQQETFRIDGAGLRAVWENSLLQLRNRKRARITKCVQCRIQSLCAMCPANGEMENGDPDSPVEFLCQVAHLRAATIGVEIPVHGECAFCAGGTEHQGLLESARRIQNKEVDVESWVGPQHLLPILNNSTAALGGCGSCASH
ncbi:MAG TPA: radical SAM protein [Candidatus Sulfotelmatobacter sp.]|jgi:radical SAM protein with 4Fe4S-binding SPASM domain|nr:radical SAM protein [Candidatus Sulfotelmatobacter sp.]